MWYMQHSACYMRSVFISIQSTLWVIFWIILLFLSLSLSLSLSLPLSPSFFLYNSFVSVCVCVYACVRVRVCVWVDISAQGRCVCFRTFFVKNLQFGIYDSFHSSGSSLSSSNIGTKQVVRPPWILQLFAGIPGHLQTYRIGYVTHSHTHTDTHTHTHIQKYMYIVTIYLYIYIYIYIYILMYTNINMYLWMFFLFKVALSIQRACSRYVLETINVARKYKRRLQRRRPTVEIDNSSSALAKGAPRDNSIAQKKGVGLFSAFFSGKQSKKVSKLCFATNFICIISHW